MHEHVVAAVIRLNEAEALCRVEPLNCPGSHCNFSKMRTGALYPHDLRASLIRFQRCLGEGSRFGAINKANRLFEWASVYAIAPTIASRSGRHDETLIKRKTADHPRRLICSSVTTRSMFSVLLLMR